MTVRKLIYGPVTASDSVCRYIKVTVVHRGDIGLIKWNTVSKFPILQWDILVTITFINVDGSNQRLGMNIDGIYHSYIAMVYRAC